LEYAYLNEQSLFVHLLVTIFVVGLGFIFSINYVEWIVTIAFVGLAAALELLNTAIEAVVNMITDKYHPLAKIAKDCSSASVFVISLLGIVAGLIIYVPKIMAVFS
jgi:diacylglycerol kinase